MVTIKIIRRRFCCDIIAVIEKPMPIVYSIKLLNRYLRFDDFLLHLDDFLSALAGTDLIVEIERLFHGFQVNLLGIGILEMIQVLQRGIQPVALGQQLFPFLIQNGCVALNQTGRGIRPA